MRAVKGFYSNIGLQLEKHMETNVETGLCRDVYI